MLTYKRSLTLYPAKFIDRLGTQVIESKIIEFHWNDMGDSTKKLIFQGNVFQNTYLGHHFEFFSTQS